MHTHEHSENLAEAIFHDILLHGILDTLKLALFLFAAYLLMEFLEHKASDKTSAFLKRSGKLGPLVGGALGAIPQCGFSSVSANLFCGKVISLGTLIAVFLSTSDEMLPIMLSGIGDRLSAAKILFILGYKILVGVAVGFAVDLVVKLASLGHSHDDGHGHIHELCEAEGCNCEGGIFRSAIKHTLTTSLFILVITVAINAILFFLGEEKLSMLLPDIPVVSHLICALIGLIPNCASSVALTEFYMSDVITLGEMLAGLFAGSGVGLLILFRVNKKNIKENLIILAILIASGTFFGLLGDALLFESLFQ